MLVSCGRKERSVCGYRPSQSVKTLQPAVGEEAVRLDLVAAWSCSTKVGQHGLVVLPLRRLAPVLLIVIPLRTDQMHLVFILQRLAFFSSG